MNDENQFIKKWIKVGIVAGFFVSVIYPLIIFAPLPLHITLVLAASVGPLLSISSIGLYSFIKIHRKTVSLQIAILFNIIAGAIFTMMLIVQMAIRKGINDDIADAANSKTPESLDWILRSVNNVQLGLDISWDIFILVGTVLFALNMLRHPRLGKTIGLIGVFIACMTMGLNLYTFPTPPSEAGLVDLGPFIGLWYLTVTIVILRSWKWLGSALSDQK
ncbi:MAG: hypothetical protein PVH84_15055 [Candidatus Aminicenantes bacterium]|jgi:hypothetical protein